MFVLKERTSKYKPILLMQSGWSVHAGTSAVKIQLFPFPTPLFWFPLLKKKFPMIQSTFVLKSHTSPISNTCKQIYIKK